MLLRRQVAAAADAIEHVAKDVMEAYRQGRVVDEPHITERFTGGVEASLNMMHRLEAHYPVRWEAKALRTASGSAAEEKRFGADLLGVLTIQMPDYKMAKGFLAQAKRAEPGSHFSSRDWDRLQHQCEAMSEVSVESYVLVFSKKRGMRFLRSDAVRGLTRSDLLSLPSMPTRAFFGRHFLCFIGDPRLNRPHVQTLEASARVMELAGNPRNVLTISVSREPS